MHMTVSFDASCECTLYPCAFSLLVANLPFSTKGFVSLKLVFVLQQICHRDLKLENTLLDGSPAPRLKICDFGYSKVWWCSRDLRKFICSPSLSTHPPLKPKKIQGGKKKKRRLICTNFSSSNHSRLCCIRGQNQLLELPLILLPKFYLEENMTARYICNCLY